MAQNVPKCWPSKTPSTWREVDHLVLLQAQPQQPCLGPLPSLLPCPSLQQCSWTCPCCCLLPSLPQPHLLLHSECDLPRAELPQAELSRAECWWPKLPQLSCLPGAVTCGNDLQTSCSVFCWAMRTRQRGIRPRRTDSRHLIMTVFQTASMMMLMMCSPCVAETTVSIKTDHSLQQ